MDKASSVNGVVTPGEDMSPNPVYSDSPYIHVVMPANYAGTGWAVGTVVNATAGTIIGPDGTMIYPRVGRRLRWL